MADIHDIRRDVHGFCDNADEIYADLPVIVWDEDGDRPSPYFGVIDLDNWGDWLSDLEKPCYRHYIRMADVIADAKEKIKMKDNA